MRTTARTPLGGGVGSYTAEFAIETGKKSYSCHDARAHVLPIVGEIIDA
jgi:hypothetical protein